MDLIDGFSDLGTIGFQATFQVCESLFELFEPFLILLSFLIGDPAELISGVSYLLRDLLLDNNVFFDFFLSVFIYLLLYEIDRIL